MDVGIENESVHGESQTASVEEYRQLSELTSGNPEEGQTQQGKRSTDDALHRQPDEGKTVESVRSSLSNFRQSASRTTGQIRELLETSKALDHDLVVFLQDPQTRAFLEGIDDDDDDDNNLMDIADEASSDNPKEIEALKQKTKSLKRKLRKWRKAARMALSEICPDISADAQGDMTPGTMKNVLQKIRQLKSLTDRQTSIILTLTGQCEAQKSESDEKDALIMELLRNCNGIRPALVKGDQPSEKIPSGASSLEGMTTKRETIDYPLITAAEVEEVLTQTGIQFGSAHLIPKQISHDAHSSTESPPRPENATVSRTPRSIERVAADHSDVDAKSTDDRAPFQIHQGSMRGLRQATSNKRGIMCWGAAVGAATGFGSLIVGHLSRRHHN